MKKIIQLGILFLAIGTTLNAQSAPQKDKYGYNSTDSRFNKPTTSSTTNNSSSSSGQNRSSSANSSSSSSNNSSSNSTPSSYRTSNNNSTSSYSSPAITESKSAPVRAPRTTAQPQRLEPGQVHKAQ